MVPREQEKAKTIISDEKDWIIWRTKPVKGEQGEQPGGSGNCQATTDFLEQFGMRLDGIQQKGPKTQRTSEDRSRGGFTRRRGWYHTNRHQDNGLRSGYGDLDPEGYQRILAGGRGSGVGHVAE